MGAHPAASRPPRPPGPPVPTPACRGPATDRPKRRPPLPTSEPPTALTKYLFQRKVLLGRSQSARELLMIDFNSQVVVVTGAGRGLGRLYATELARRGAAVVVNDLGGTMHGAGADETVANLVVSEIEAAGGKAVASHHSVDS